MCPKLNQRRTIGPHRFARIVWTVAREMDCREDEIIADGRRKAYCRQFCMVLLYQYGMGVCEIERMFNRSHGVAKQAIHTVRDMMDAYVDERDRYDRLCALLRIRRRRNQPIWSVPTRPRP